MNEFLKFKERIAEAKIKYLAAKKYDRHIGNVESVNRLARPFERGHFTLAIIGGMSSGKSSFLNAFLGEKNLLPTGGDQTTCSLTSIYYSKKEKVSVEYMDGHIDVFNANSNSDLKDILTDTVAIPQEFGNGFPLLEINNDILCGLSESDILKKANKYSNIAKRQITTSELSNYLKTHKDPSKFVKEVSVGINLSSLKGWKIVDTPGVCALGGIEELTRNYIFGTDEYGYDNVDAVLLVYKGSVSLQEHPELTEFIKDVTRRKKSIIAERSFMIVTHSASDHFQDNPNYLNNALNQIDNLIPKERIFYVDNNLELFCRIREREGKDFMDMITKSSLEDWPIETTRILKAMKSDFLEERDKDMILNEDFINEIQKLSQFHILREKLEKFIVERKQKAYDEIIQLIKDDLDNLANRKNEDKAKVEKDLRGEQDLASQIEDEKKKNEASRLEFNNFVDSLRTDYSVAKIRRMYQNISQAAKGISSLNSISLISAEAESIEYDLKEKKDEILREVEKKSKNYFSNLHIPSFPVLDFKSIINKAQKSESNQKDNWQAGNGLGNFLKRTFSKIAGIFSDKYEHYGMTNCRIPDIEKVSRECKDEIIKAIYAYVDSTNNAIENYISEADKKIKETDRITQENNERLVKTNKTVEEKDKTIQLLKKEIDTLTETIETIKSIAYDN